MKKFLLVMLVIGGLMMVGCDRKNSLSWLENKFGNELSRVYPTENLEDLFEEFPDGFVVRQNYINSSKNSTELELNGDAKTKSINGVLKISNRKNAEDIENIPFHYEQGKLVFKNNKRARELWPFYGFLFQSVTIDRNYLSNLKLKKQAHNFQNGDMSLVYQLNDSKIKERLNLKDGTEYTMELGGSESNRGYYYSVVIRGDDESRFGETVLDSKN